MKRIILALSLTFIMGTLSIAGDYKYPTHSYGSDKMLNAIRERNRQMRNDEKVRRQQMIEMIKYKADIILQQAEMGVMTAEGRRFLEKYLGPEVAQGAANLNERAKREREQNLNTDSKQQ